MDTQSNDSIGQLVCLGFRLLRDFANIVNLT